MMLPPSLYKKVLAVMLKVLELLKPLGSDQTLQGNARGSARHDHLVTAAKELEQAWERSLHCQLQLQTRLMILLDWAVRLQQDGGILGKETPVRGWVHSSGFLWATCQTLTLNMSLPSVLCVWYDPSLHLTLLLHTNMQQIALYQLISSRFTYFSAICAESHDNEGSR